MPLAPELLVRRLPTVMQFIAYPGLLIYADPSPYPFALFPAATTQVTPVVFIK